MDYIITACTPDDLPVLQELSRRTFGDAFAHLNTPENMEIYLTNAFNTERLQTELANQASYFYFITVQDILCGYIKLNIGGAQTEGQDADALEIERIYITKAFQGNGLGNALISKAAEVASSLHKTCLWLGVWEHNHNALRFYKHNGFSEAGRHDFYLGKDKQTDYILRKDL